MKLHRFVLLALWHCALADTLPQFHECCPHNGTVVGNKCQDEKNLTHTLNSMFKCEHGLFEIEMYPSIENDFIDITIGCIGYKMEVEEDNETGTHDTIKQVLFLCFPDEISYTNIWLTIVPLSISICGLILTVIVYMMVPDLRDTQGVCTMCLCGSLALGFLHILLAQFHEAETVTFLCFIIGFGMYFWLIASFFWMNVIAFEMMKSATSIMKNISEKRMIQYYHIYGWGMPLLLLVITICINFIKTPYIDPDLRNYNCWMGGNIELSFYFFGPVALVLIANIVLFGVTCKALWYKTSYTNVTKLRSLKYRFCMFLKLFFITGIFWVFELSTLFGGLEIIWFFTDLLNTLSGLLYFLILVVFRKKARRGIAKLGFRIPCMSVNDEIEEEEIIEEMNEP